MMSSIRIDEVSVPMSAVEMSWRSKENGAKAWGGSGMLAAEGALAAEDASSVARASKPLCVATGSVMTSRGTASRSGVVHHPRVG